MTARVARASMPDAPPLAALPLRSGLERSVARLLAAVRAAGFWLAVALPVAYPAALLTAVETLPLLLAGHAAAVALGHGHQPGRGPRAADSEE